MVYQILEKSLYFFFQFVQIIFSAIKGQSALGKLSKAIMNSFLAGLGSQQQQPTGSTGSEAVVADGKMIDLTKTHLDKSDCYARNEATAFPMTNLFIGDTRLGCKSDADEQLIIHISFNEFVKVSDVFFFKKYIRFPLSLWLHCFPNFYYFET